MIRVAAVILLIGAAAFAGSAVFVDGRKVDRANLAEANAENARFELRGRDWTVPTKTLVAYDTLPVASPDESVVFNLYLSNGDRLHGTVVGQDNGLALTHDGIEGMTVPLDRVRAVCFGRLLQGLQTKYAEAFRAELARGQDVVVVQRDTRPFPIRARVTVIGEKALTVIVGDQRRELPLHKVYGFVRAVDTPDPAARKGMYMVLRLRDGGHATLPLEAIERERIRAGKVTIDRAGVSRIEFTGDHVAHLSDFDPIRVKEVALFGKAPTWRRNAMVFGGPLRLHGTTYARGIGVHAYSRIEYVLGARWRYFFVRCGIDDAAAPEGAAVFRLYGDGKLLKEIGARQGQRPEPALLDVEGIDRLVLEASPGDSYTSDFCDWAEARVFNAKPVAPPEEK